MRGGFLGMGCSGVFVSWRDIPDCWGLRFGRRVERWAV